MSLQIAVKTCRICGVEKPLSDFHRRARSRDRHQHECKVCKLAETLANRDRRRAEMGEEAWKRHQNRIVYRHRRNPENRERRRRLAKARNLAVKRLIAAHPDEYARLYDLARVEMGLPVNRWEREP